MNLRPLLFATIVVAAVAGCASAPAAPATPTALPTLPAPTRTALPTAASTSIPTSTAQPTTPPIDVPSVPPTVIATTTPTDQPTALPTEAADDPVLVGAGDIAVCGAAGDEATARILDGIEGTVFTLGDNVYPSGTLEEYQTCYEESWGRHKARTRPVPGNHDYNSGGQGYYDYFGAVAGEPGRGYYSYDLGAWHVIVLNSEIETGEGSGQIEWLRADLQAHPATCTIALMHRPLFSSGPHGRDGSGEKVRPLWEVLYENNADVVAGGHDHNYERFARQNPQGEIDEARGIRQFVAGTGGAAPYPFGDVKPNSERHIAGPFGVLKLTLHATSYDWEFVSIAPLLFKDSGTGECH